MEEIMRVGLFWAVPDKDGGQSVLEFHENCKRSEADRNGFIDYPRSHYEVWEEQRRGDCYKYPRGRVLYDVNAGKHRIFADECVLPSTIARLVEIFQIRDYELCRDEHYVCAFCSNKRRDERAELEYRIVRGRNRIGENLIEISYGGTVVLVELGRSLNGGDEKLERDVLDRRYSAVVVSHYHEDHAGLIKYKRDCPVFIGGGAYRIMRARCEFCGEEPAQNIKTYSCKKPFCVGGIKITPFLCDHSAFDSYMLLFEAGGKSILYTGDFRFHGRKGKDKLLNALPKKVDVLIHEGTNIGKNACTMTETELENRAVEIMNGDAPVFVLQSSTNIDRLGSVYRASKRCGRLLYMDNFNALIAIAAGGSIPRPDAFKDVVAFTPRYVRGARRDMFLEIQNKRGLKDIAGGTLRFTMLVRPSMRGFIKKLLTAAGINSATLVYSMWNGYKDNEDMKKFLGELAAMGVNIVDLHTSGHASENDIELLKKTVGATHTVCVHTEAVD